MGNQTKKKPKIIINVLLPGVVPIQSNPMTEDESWSVRDLAVQLTEIRESLIRDTNLKFNVEKKN